MTRGHLGYNAAFAAAILLAQVVAFIPGGDRTQHLHLLAEVVHLSLLGLLAVQNLFLFRLQRWRPALMYGLLLLAAWAASLLHMLWPAFPVTVVDALVIYSAAGAGVGIFTARRLTLTVVGMAVAGSLLALMPLPLHPVGHLGALALLYLGGRLCLGTRPGDRTLRVAALLLAGSTALTLAWGHETTAGAAAAVLRTIAYAGLMLGAYHDLLRAHQATADAFLAIGVDAGTLMGALDEVIYVMAPTGTLLYVSDAIRRYGLTPQELRGRTWAELAAPEPPPPAVGEGLRLPIFGLRHREMGVLHWLEESSRLAQVGGHWLIIGTLRDVTARIGLERRLLESTRLAAVGELSAGIAHNFNNLLAGISVRAEHLLLLATRTGEQRLQQGLEAILENTRRGADITRKLLTFARGGQAHLQPLQMAQSVREALEVVEPLRLERLTVHVEVPPDLRALADASHLQQVLVNLIINAAQAMPDGGNLYILGQPVNEWVHLAICDTGVGIPPEHLSRIFEPFFTTKRETLHGTGLGLSVSLGMMRSMGGDLLVESKVGAGSTFTLVLSEVQ